MKFDGRSLCGASKPLSRLPPSERWSGAAGSMWSLPQDDDGTGSPQVEPFAINLIMRQQFWRNQRRFIDEDTASTSDSSATLGCLCHSYRVILALAFRRIVAVVDVSACCSSFGMSLDKRHPQDDQPFSLMSSALTNQWTSSKNLSTSSTAAAASQCSPARCC